MDLVTFTEEILYEKLHFLCNNVLMKILITEFFLTYIKLVIHQIETSQSICKSIDWFLYDGNLNMNWSNEIHEIIQEGIKQTCKGNYSRVLFKFHRIFLVKLYREVFKTQSNI